MDTGHQVGVLGAGAIGLFVGGHLALQGVPVRFAGRSVLRRAVEQPALLLTDFQRPGFEGRLPTASLDARYDPKELAADPPAAAVLVCVKSGDSSLVSCLRDLPRETVVVSLQNGVDNVELIRGLLPGHTVLAGMVPYGVNEMAPGHFHRGTPGALALQRGCPDWLVAALRKSGLDVEVHSAEDMRAIQWFKLIVNLANALNALDGRPIGEAVQDRNYRRLMSCLWAEGLAACAAAGIPLRGNLNGRPLPVIQKLFLLPDVIFLRFWKPMGVYRSSMYADLDQRRDTEVAHLQGRIVELGRRHGAPCPLNALVQRLVEEAQAKRAGSPRIPSAQLVASAVAAGATLRRLPEDILPHLLAGAAVLAAAGYALSRL